MFNKFIVVIILATFQCQRIESQSPAQTLAHGEVYRIQNYYSGTYLTACYGGNSSNPTCVQTGPLGGGSGPSSRNDEQLWEINEADFDKSINTSNRHIRSLKYMFNSVTFERKLCPMTNTMYTATITYLPVLVDENSTKEDALWYLRKNMRKCCTMRSDSEPHSCLTQSRGNVFISECHDEENQQWRIFNVEKI